MNFEEVMEEIKEIKSKYPAIEKIILFGSRARGDFSPTSDIDLCLFGTNLLKEDFRLISLEIDEIYTYYQFDILHFDAISNEQLKQNILSEGVRIC